MTYLLWLLPILFSPSRQDVEALRRSAPLYLTAESAKDHLVAARVAGYLYRLDPDLILSIAHHESRYTVDAIAQEPGNKESCGPMTPIPLPKGECDPNSITVGEGYRVGAEHLRGWITACKGSLRCALRGYAGGYALIAACKQGPYLRHKTHGDDICRIPDTFLQRARYIRNLRERGPRS